MLYFFLFIAVSVIKILDYIYLFQIKEYRLDRIKNFVQEEGIWNALYARTPQMPSRSIRNQLIAILSFAQLFGVLWLLRGTTNYLLAAYILFNPFVTFTLVAIGVFLTGILASYQRNKIVQNARIQISTSKAVFIGITGSYGKSSIKEFLHQVLSHSYTVGKTEANMNTDVGVALSILKNLQPNTEYFITEMGAYRIGEIAKICNLVRPSIAILNPISNQHLGLFGSKQNLIKAKLELLQSLPKEGRAYIHVSNMTIPQLSDLVCQKIFFGSGAGADITLTDITIVHQPVKGTITYKSHMFPIQINLTGLHNIENILAAVAVALDCGMTPQNVQHAVSTLSNVAGKLSTHIGFQEATILNDSQNSNMEGFIAAIKTATHYPHKHKYIISKGIIELGEEKKQSYQHILDILNTTNVTLLTTDKLFFHMKSQDNVQFFHTETDILKHLSTLVNKDTLLVLEGKFTKPFTQRLII